MGIMYDNTFAKGENKYTGPYQYDKSVPKEMLILGKGDAKRKKWTEERN